MDVARPYLALLPRVPGATLAALSRTSQPLTGREVARRAGASQPAVQAALRHLVEHGLVLVQHVGRAHVYRLNRDHLAADAVEDILGMRVRLIERLRRQVASWQVSPVHASLFGSAARGDGDVHSDVDILLVRPARPRLVRDDPSWARQVSDLERDVEEWTGNRAAPLDVALDELRAMQRRRHRLVADILRDAVLIHGEPVEALLRQPPRRRTTT